MRRELEEFRRNPEPIQVMVPWARSVNGYSQKVNAGAAYNRAMQRATSEWVLFLDHDLFLCNRHWYSISCKAIEYCIENRIKTGWISAVTNRIGNPAQKVPGAPLSHDIAEHCLFAKGLYEMHGSKVEQCRGAMSGFWILTNKKAWRDVGGFNENRPKILGVDNDYSGALSRAGYTHQRMPGLYVYHIYHQKKLYQRW